ncbi:MAG TPA: MoaD/ThiS family protein [Acidimicrobiales bacterium]|nr:MoaD/ThiS family protein [Acidimicrobiales bacterium]
MPIGSVPCAQTPDSGAVTVLFFAAAREAAGTSRASLDCSGRSVAGLLEQLGAAYGPAMAQLLQCCSIWVNGSQVPSTTVLNPGDEVAVLPPVSGG